MKAMLIKSIGSVSRERDFLVFDEISDPLVGPDEILIEVSACGVCHTEIDEIEGRVLPSFLPIVPGHQVIGYVVEKGKNVRKFNIGDLAGAGWIFSSCGECEFCLQGNENLCIDFKATGVDANGGYAEYMKICENFAIRMDGYSKEDIPFIAPLMCAGAIGYRALRLSSVNGKCKLGLSGFGSSAHLVLKMARHIFPDIKVCVFARNEEERSFALKLGADWAGDFEDQPPYQLDAIIDTTPVWWTVLASLKNLKPGGRLIINAIRKEEGDKEVLLKLNYSEHLWKEKEIKSVANVSRFDIEKCVEICRESGIRARIQKFELKDAKEALLELKEGIIKGSKVLVM